MFKRSKRSFSKFKLSTILLTIFSFLVLTLTVNQTRKIILYKSKAASNTYDIVVYGAGTGGSFAAIQAARMGSKVLLIEPTDWVGGQMTSAGVPNMDGGEPEWTQGLYTEYINLIRAHYNSKNKSIGTCYWDKNSVCFEPNVGQMILRQLLSNEPNIVLLLNTKVTQLTKTLNTITGVITDKGDTMTSKIVIDASEYGDLIPLSGANYRVGNSTNSSLNTSACIQDITYTAIIKKYPSGVPPALVITTPPPGYDSVKYYFSTQLSKTGSSVPAQIPANWNNFVAYRGLPDSSNPSNYDTTTPQNITRTSLNWFNDYEVLADYLINPTTRTNINCAAKLKTIQLLYYIQTVMGQTNWSVANDEGYNTLYNQQNSCANIPASLKEIEYQMPLIPYVREGIRVIGNNTFTAKQANMRQPLTGSTDSIAIGTYFLDLHNCKSCTCQVNNNLENSLETAADNIHVPGPFVVPLYSLIPAGIDGFIVAEKNLSQSRLANGGTRLQPITILTGQAAGALASLSVSKNLQPRNVPLRDVQDILITNGKSLLYPFSDLAGSSNFSSTQRMSVRGIMTNFGSFKASDTLNRAQVSQVTVNAFNLAIYKPAIATFSDVPTTHPYFSYIETIYKNGISSGCSTSPKLFCPDSIFTNEALTVFLLRGWKIINPTINSFNPTIPIYSDSKTSTFFQFIEGLAKDGVVVYCNSTTKTFCPTQFSTKAYISNFVDQILKKQF